MTECALLTVGRPSDSLTLRLTDGSPLPGNEVRVIDEAGEPVVGVEGNLQCRGSELFVGYVQGRELTEGCWQGSWFDTGDRALMNDGGYIRITGRSKEHHYSRRRKCSGNGNRSPSVTPPRGFRGGDSW